jgi:hypothetical protein
MEINLSTIRDAFHLPRPNWQVIRAWVDRHVPEPDRTAAWDDLAVQWLAILDEALGNAYCIERTNNLLCFAPANSGQAGLLAQVAQASLSEVGNLLGEIASDRWHRPLVLLLFADPATYYSYIAQFYSAEGEFGGSGGICIRSDGYLQ